MEEKKETAQILREIADAMEGTAAPAALLGGPLCDNLRKLAGMIEDEVEHAYMEGTGHYFDMIAEENDWPKVRKGELIEDYIKRCFLPVPRYESGEPVAVGKVCEFGTIAMAEVRMTDGGWGNWTLYTEELTEPVDGTLSQRIGCGQLVDGNPVSKGDVLWFGRDSVIVDWVTPCGHIMTDYTTTDAEGGEIAYPFEPEELSWAPEPDRKPCPDSVGRLQADARKSYADYWGCGDEPCDRCPAAVEGENPRKRFEVASCSKAQMLDIVRRAEEVVLSAAGGAALYELPGGKGSCSECGSVILSPETTAFCPRCGAAFVPGGRG